MKVCGNYNVTGQHLCITALPAFETFNLLTYGMATPVPQVAESFNELITAMSGISNLDDTIRKLDILITSARHDLDALIDKSKGFTMQKDFSVFQQQTQNAEAQVNQAINAVEERVANLELLVPRVEDHEKRIAQMENTIRAHAQLLGTHGELLQEHSERLHTREAVADQHGVSIMDLMDETRRHAQNFLHVQEQLKERQRTRDVLVASMDNQFANVDARFALDAANLDAYKDSVANRLASERKQTLSDVSSLEKRVGARTDSLRREVQDNEAQTVARLQNLDALVNTEAERVEAVFTEKWTKLGNDVDRQNRILRKNIDENLSLLQKTVAETQEGANSDLRNAKHELLIGQKSFEVEVNRKVDVFRDTIKSIGPEIEDIVRRETFDMMKQHLDEHSRKLQMLIDAKVGQDIIKQELAKKADVLTLGAYTKKTDADALVSNAMGEHAKQVEMFLMNTILDNPIKSGIGGPRNENAGDEEEMGHHGRLKMLELENYTLKQGECINELYQMMKDLHTIVDKDTKSQHYKTLRANPSNYLSARTLTPVTNAVGASQGLPLYVHQLTLPDKLTPRSGSSVQHSARSALQGWGASNTDRSHYNAGSAVGNGVGREEALGTGIGGRAVSFAEGDTATRTAGHEAEIGGIASQKEASQRKQEAGSAAGTGSARDESLETESPSDMLVLDLIEEELRVRNAAREDADHHGASGIGLSEEKEKGRLVELESASIYESNSPQVALL